MKREQINIGNFNEPITWKKPTASTSSFGNVERSFATHKTDFADVQPVNLGENEVANRLQYTETYAFTAHFDSEINTKYQIEYSGEDYNILKIETINLKRFIRVTARKLKD